MLVEQSRFVEVQSKRVLGVCKEMELCRMELVLELGRNLGLVLVLVQNKKVLELVLGKKVQVGCTQELVGVCKLELGKQRVYKLEVGHRKVQVDCKLVGYTEEVEVCKLELVLGKQQVYKMVVEDKQVQVGCTLEVCKKAGVECKLVVYTLELGIEEPCTVEGQHQAGHTLVLVLCTVDMPGEACKLEERSWVRCRLAVSKVQVPGKSGPCMLELSRLVYKLVLCTLEEYKLEPYTLESDKQE